MKYSETHGEEEEKKQVGEQVTAETNGKQTFISNDAY